MRRRLRKKLWKRGLEAARKLAFYAPVDGDVVELDKGHEEYVRLLYAEPQRRSRRRRKKR